MKKGKCILDVQLLKVLYRCMQSALLQFKLFTSTLEGMDFKINPYIMCIANKTINSSTQFTICWYVDDLKQSQMSLGIVKEIITKIEERYGKMTVTYGKKHTYVRMDIHFPGNGEVKISLFNYLKECKSQQMHIFLRATQLELHYSKINERRYTAL